MDEELLDIARDILKESNKSRQDSDLIVELAVELSQRLLSDYSDDEETDWNADDPDEEF